MNWGTWGRPTTGQGSFSFGPLSGLQQTLYENKPELAYQQFTDWFGAGNPAFNNTILGRWLAQQQTPLQNRFLTQQAADPSGKLTWTNFLEQQSREGTGNLAQQFALLPGYMRGSNPGMFRNRRELW